MKEQYLVSIEMPLEDAVPLCHTAQRDGTINDIMEQINQDCNPKHKCSCNPPCKVCACKNR